MHILKDEILTRSIPTENIIVAGRRGSRAHDIQEAHILDQHPVGGIPGRTTVEIILLDVDAVDRGALDLDVGVGDVGDVAGGVVVCFDAAAVLRVDDC